jgi:hypothetical protein
MKKEIKNLSRDRFLLLFNFIMAYQALWEIFCYYNKASPPKFTERKMVFAFSTAVSGRGE